MADPCWVSSEIIGLFNKWRRYYKIITSLFKNLLFTRPTVFAEFFAGTMIGKKGTKAYTNPKIVVNAAKDLLLFFAGEWAH